MDKSGLESARSGIAHTLDEAFAVLERTGLPSIIRPSFTMGGTGGGIAYNREEFEHIVRGGLIASPTTEVLIEESLLGWKEYEMEVVRDRKDNCIIICSIENVDPMGVHTGDRSEEHTSELQSLMRISYAVFCLKKKKDNIRHTKLTITIKNKTHSK